MLGGSRKGQAMAIPGPIMAGIAAVFGLFLIGIFIFAFALAGAEMMDAVDVTENQTSTAVEIINSTIQGAQSFANFSPTLWIIVAIGILIGLLLVFVGGFFLVRGNQ